MVDFLPNHGPTYGLGMIERTCWVYNRTGGTAAQGEVLMFDLALSATETTTAEPGVSGSGWSNVVDPTAAAEEVGFFCVVKDADGIADNALGEVITSSPWIDILVHSASGAAGAIWDPLMIDLAQEANSLELDPVATEHRMILGVLLEITADASTPALLKCAFDGINGFGTIGEVT